jgi:hypothetical protein
MTTQHANTTYVPRTCTSIFGNWYMKLYYHYSMNPWQQCNAHQHQQYMCHVSITTTTSLKREQLEPTWPSMNLLMIRIKSLVPLKRPNVKGLNYFKYVKWMDLHAHVHVFKVVIQANSEIEGANIVNFFEFTFRDLDLD